MKITYRRTEKEILAYISPAEYLQVWSENYNDWMPVYDMQGESIPEVKYSVNPNDIRKAGWSVAVHNDFKINRNDCTFWLFTKDNQCVKGEGPTDVYALLQVRLKLGLL